MPFMLAIWKNETVSVFRVSRNYTTAEVFDELDTIGSPFDTRAIYELRSINGTCHATTKFAAGSDGVKRQEWCDDQCSLREVSFDWNAVWIEQVKLMRARSAEGF